jgi:signal transduction histidine kinase
LKLRTNRPFGATLTVSLATVILTTVLVLWDKLHAPTVPLAPKIALLGAILGFIVVVGSGFVRAAGRESQELHPELRELRSYTQAHESELQRIRRELLVETAKRNAAEESLQSVSAQLLDLQDGERRRIARDLHDGTVQSLAGIAINLERAQQAAQTDERANLDGLLLEARDMLEQVTLEIRTLSYLLHPPMLEELGLEYVLPNYVEGFSRRSGIAVSLTIQPTLGRLPREIENTFFRILQESLTNIHRHSGSRTAEIALFGDSRSAILEIKDQGSGIPDALSDSAMAFPSKLGVGIGGMRERVRQLGGHLSITGHPEGTEIRVVLPVSPPAAASSSATHDPASHSFPTIRPEVA